LEITLGGVPWLVGWGWPAANAMLGARAAAPAATAATLINVRRETSVWSDA
jgi:hypothetical protein